MRHRFSSKQKDTHNHLCICSLLYTFEGSLFAPPRSAFLEIGKRTVAVTCAKSSFAPSDRKVARRRRLSGYWGARLLIAISKVYYSLTTLQRCSSQGICLIPQPLQFPAGARRFPLKSRRRGTTTARFVSQRANVLPKVRQFHH